MPSLRASHLLLPATLAASVGLVVASGPALFDELSLMHAASALGWRAALASCGTRTGRFDAVARYSIGSAINAVTPLRLGSAARVALFARLAPPDGGLWQVGGAAAAAGAMRGAWFALLVAGAAAAGVIPWWPVVAFVAIAVCAGTAAVVSRRIQLKHRVGHVLDAFRELGRSPRELAAVAVCTATALVAKVGAVTMIASAVGVDHPLLAGLVVVPAVELAAVLPVTPGNIGVASAAVAFALESQGAPAEAALAAGIAFGAVEPFAALVMGGIGTCGLFGYRVVPTVRFAAAATGALGFVGLFGATVLLPL
jgi:uncharacterized membrane protein YbhN (UPF0104 family)